ncbi:MAG: hypothetical protein MMC23_009597 [Stictis urceolatum]|nr:hypothetical protein [Stictis urceolata]
MHRAAIAPSRTKPWAQADRTAARWVQKGQGVARGQLVNNSSRECSASKPGQYCKTVSASDSRQTEPQQSQSKKLKLQGKQRQRGREGGLGRGEERRRGVQAARQRKSRLGAPGVRRKQARKPWDQKGERISKGKRDKGRCETTEKARGGGTIYSSQQKRRGLAIPDRARKRQITAGSRNQPSFHRDAHYLLIN